MFRPVTRCVFIPLGAAELHNESHRAWSGGRGGIVRGRDIQWAVLPTVKCWGVNEGCAGLPLLANGSVRGRVRKRRGSGSRRRFSPWLKSSGSRCPMTAPARYVFSPAAAATDALTRPRPSDNTAPAHP